MVDWELYKPRQCHVPYPCSDAHIVLGGDFGEDEKWLRIYLGKWGISLPIGNEQFRALVDQIKEDRSGSKESC